MNTGGGVTGFVIAPYRAAKLAAAAQTKYDAHVAQVKKNLVKLTVGASAAGIVPLHGQIGKSLELL